jgi:predicted nuclease of predicted toxin-antitoxin system
MARVLLDACVPQWLRRELAGHDVETAHFAGLGTLPDRELLDAIEGRYDMLVTLDRNLIYQNRVGDRSFAVIAIRVADQTPAAFHALLPQLRTALAKAVPGRVIAVSEEEGG